MQMTLTTRRGEVIALPETFVLDDADISMDVPGTEVPGRPGRLRYPGLARVTARTLNARAIIKGVSREEADALALQLQGQLLGNGVMQLRRDAGDDRYIWVDCRRVRHNYHPGRFGGALASFQIQFQADDPYWYASTPSQFEVDPVEFDSPVTLISVENEGSAPVDPIIWILGHTHNGNHVKNFKLINYTTGHVVAYDGELKESDILILDSARKKAIKLSGTVMEAGTAQGGTSDTITLRSQASSVDGAYVGRVIRITSGKGEGQLNKILGYNGANRTAILVAEWDIVPDHTSKYEIYHLAFLEGYFLHEAMWGEFTGGESVLGQMNTGFMLNGFPLASGVNRIEVQEENELMGLSILWTPRWI